MDADAARYGRWDACWRSSGRPPTPTRCRSSDPDSVVEAPDHRLARLERELAELREQVRGLREALGEPDSPQA